MTSENEDDEKADAMQTPEEQLEQLEAYLDGALPAAEAEELRRRLESDATLTAALERLKGERAVRQQVWQSMEPAGDEPIADCLLDGIHTSLRQQQRARRWRIVQYISSAAACVIIGFALTWVVNQQHQQSQGPGAGSPAVAELPPQVPAMRLVGNAPEAAASQSPQSPGPIQVILTDPAGRTLGVYGFPDVESAREFMRRVNTAPARLGVGVRSLPGNHPLRAQWPALGEEPALRIEHVMAGSAAERAGLRRGDLILGRDGEAVSSPSAFAASVAKHQSGPMPLRILRQGQEMVVPVELPEK